ncbi:hypothetical protein [Streptomyces virginiae]|uniref:hypothetical protein n=1 Tax=Streptomyces virginiae TaxID=1961 RepID=UPI00324908D0
MLSYLAAALPPSAGPQARLLALQCALRADRHGRVQMPAGLLRGMHLAGREAEVWHELEEACWLHHLWLPSGRHQAQLLDSTVLTQAPGRTLRLQAAGLALHWAYSPATRAQPAIVRLTSVALGAYLFPGSACGTADLEGFARICALSEERLTAVMECLGNAGVLSAWSLDHSAGELNWRAAGADRRVGMAGERGSGAT